MNEWLKIDQIEVSHEDERRSITAVFNGGFDAKQIKILKIKKDSILGNHYHNYRELFYIVKGQAVFNLENVETKESYTVILRKGGRLLLEPKIAHRVKMFEGTFTVEATEQPYISSNDNDVRYEITWGKD